jgi:hypothetical protein
LTAGGYHPPLPVRENGKLGVKFTSHVSFCEGNFGIFLGLFSNSPYAERPEGCRKSNLFFIQTFGTARNIS